MTWTPELRPGATLHDALLAALKDDVAAERLPAGTRLPPQRDLAWRLGVSVGTVTRVYSEAERLGLVAGQVGRGTYVTGPADRDDAPVDLSRNTPPLLHARMHLAQTLGALSARPDLVSALAYAPVFGSAELRAAAAAWLVRSLGGGFPGAGRVLVTSGAQNGLALALDVYAAGPEPIMCEAVTFTGFRTLAAARGRTLLGVEMDAQGMLPDALDRRAAASGARLVYLTPTLQNPTARTMGAARRADIVAVARRHGLWLLEDDIYGVIAGPDRPCPLALLAPERTIYVSGLSKVLAPGLRVGLLVPPQGCTRGPALERASAAIAGAPEPFGRAIALEWLGNGIADRIADELRVDLAARVALAGARLGDRIDMPGAAASLHVWLPMEPLAAERVARRAAAARVAVTPPGAGAIDGHAPTGVRLCLGGALGRTALERALRIVAGAIDAESDPGELGLV